NDATGLDLEMIERQRSDVARRRDNLIDRLADTDDPDLAAAVQQKLAALSEAKRRPDGEYDLVLARRGAGGAGEERQADVEAQCAKVAGRVGTLTYEMRRLALQWLAIEVRVFRADHAPRYVIDGIPFTEPETISGPAASPNGHELSEASLRSWRR